MITILNKWKRLRPDPLSVLEHKNRILRETIERVSGVRLLDKSNPQNNREVATALGTVKLLERDKTLIKNAVWKMWRSELVHADRNTQSLMKSLRNLVAVVAEFEVDRREKAPLIDMKDSEFFSRLLRFHRLQSK